MAPASDGDSQPITPGDFHGANNIGRPGTADNHRRAPVKHAVPQFADLVVGGVAGTQQITP